MRAGTSPSPSSTLGPPRAAADPPSLPPSSPAASVHFFAHTRTGDVRNLRSIEAVANGLARWASWAQDGPLGVRAKVQKISALLWSAAARRHAPPAAEGSGAAGGTGEGSSAGTAGDEEREGRTGASSPFSPTPPLSSADGLSLCAQLRHQLLRLTLPPSRLSPLRRSPYPTRSPPSRSRPRPRSFPRSRPGPPRPPRRTRPRAPCPTTSRPSGRAGATRS